MQQLIKKYFKNIEWILTVLFFVITPIIYYKKQLDPVLYTRYLTLSIWLILISTILTYKSYIKKFTFNLTKTDVLFFGLGILFILINIISSINAINSYEATFKTFKELSFLIMMFFLHQMLKNNKWGKDVIIKSVTVMTFIFLLIGIVQLMQSDFSKLSEVTEYYGYYFRQAIWNVKSTLANWNPFAYFLFLSLPFSIYGILFFKKFWRIFSIITTILSFIFISILVSKGGWIVTIIFIGICLLLIYIYLFTRYEKETKKSLSLKIKSILIISPILVIVMGGLFLKKSDILFAEVIKDKFEQLFDSEKALGSIYSVDKPTSAQTRTLVWANTINMVRDNPLLGVGPGQWRLLYAKYGLDGFEHNIRNGIKHFQRPHNDFLWIMGETGLLGFSLYLAMYIFILYIALKNMYSSKDTETRVLNMLIFSALFAFIIVLSISFTRERISHNMLYLLLMVLALVTKSNNSDDKKDIQTLRNSNIPTFILLILFSLTTFNVILANDMVKGEKAARDIKIGMLQKNNLAVLRGARSIEDSYYTLDDFAVPIPYYKGSVFSLLNKLKEANIEFKKSYKLHPYHLQTLNNLATSFNLIGDKDSALFYYKKALSISPRYEEALLNISIVYYNEGEIKKALDYLIQIPITNNVPKFKKAITIICRKRSQQLGKEGKLNITKLEEWFYDEQKIKATFFAAQTQKIPFDKNLIKEIGK